MKRRIRHILACLPPASLSGAFLAFVLCAAVSVAQTDDFSFGHRSSEDGLSQSTVNAILQDRRGFLWIGTEDGLNRYDGYSYTIFRNDPGDSTSLSDNWIMSLCEDSSGNVWIGTYNGGLNRYDPIRDRFVRYRHNPRDEASLGGRIVMALLCDRRGTLWAALWKRGIDRLDRGAKGFVHYRPGSEREGAIGSDEVRSLYETSDGALWAGTWSGLYRMDPQRERFQRVLEDDKVFCLEQDQEGLLWVGTWGRGIVLLDASGTVVRGHQGYRRAVGNLGSKFIGALTHDPAGGMWIGTWGGGLSHTAHDGFRRFVHYPSRSSALSSNEILSMLYDRSGTLWIGTERGGLNFLHPSGRRFTLYRHLPGRQEGLQYNIVKAVLSARSGDLWVGTLGGGLDRFNSARSRWEHYSHDPHNASSLSHNVVHGLHEDAGGRIWVAAAGGTLCRFNASQRSFSRYHLDATDLTAIVGDRAGLLWIGTDENGLIRFDPHTSGIRRFRNDPNDPSSLGGNSILALALDHEEALWVGTWGMGLSRMDPVTGRCQRFQHRSAGDGTISDNTVLAIHEDSSDALWIGTRGGGLNRFDRSTGTFRAYTERDGLPNNVIYGVLSDTGGRLWLSTNKGIACFTAASGVSQVYTAADGLQGNEFIQGAACRDKSGRLYFGGPGGLSSFSPADLRDMSAPPRVVFTGFRVFDKPWRMDTTIALAHQVILSYEQDHFTFEFSALDLATAERFVYLYKLDGFDRQWISAGARRFASYTHLDPGTYRFQVKAAGANNAWGDDASVITLVITPPFWNTWWFRLLGIIALLGTGFALYRFRVQQLLGQERLRMRIASDLHDELAANLSSITMYSTIVRDALAGQTARASTQHLQLLERITALGRESVTAIRDIIWATDPHVETTRDLLTRLGDAAHDLCRAKGIRLETHFSDLSQLSSENLSPEQRRDLWLLLREAVNNAINHSGCTELVLSVKASGSEFEVTVRDNGSGFVQEQRTGGKGLGTMNMRAERLGAVLTIDSREPVGTTVTVCLDL